MKFMTWGGFFSLVAGCKNVGQYGIAIETNDLDTWIPLLNIINWYLYDWTQNSVHYIPVTQFTKFNQLRT